MSLLKALCANFEFFIEEAENIWVSHEIIIEWMDDRNNGSIEQRRQRKE